MYAVNGFAGLGDSGLSIDPTGFNGTQALKGVYTFYDNGWQQSTIYETAYLWNNFWTNAYRLSFSFKPFGKVDCGDIYLKGRAEENYPITRDDGGSGAERHGRRLCDCDWNQRASASAALVAKRDPDHRQGCEHPPQEGREA